MKTLLTQRLIISPYSYEDFDACCNLYGCRINTKLFDHGHPIIGSELETLIKSKQGPFPGLDLPLGLFSVFLRNRQTFIGQIDLIPLDNVSLEIGFIFDHHYHGQGYALEATSAFINFLKDVLFSKAQSHCCIQHLVATAHPLNTNSIKLLKKLGMQQNHQSIRFHQPRIWFSLILNTTRGKKI